MRNIGNFGAANAWHARFSDSAAMSLSVNDDLAAGDAAAGPGIAHQRQRDRRFARAALADQGDDFAVGDVETDAFDDFDKAASIRCCLNPQISDFNEIGPSCAPSLIFCGKIVDQQVDADGEAGNCQRRHDNGCGCEGQAADVFVHQRAPVGKRWLHAKSKE